MEWLSNNWDKILMVVTAAAASGWAAWSRFTGRIEQAESNIKRLSERIDRIETGQNAMRDDIFIRFDKMQMKLDDIVELKIFVERTDVVLKSIQDDVRELKSDVKRIMHT